MRLARLGDVGSERPYLVDHLGRGIDVSDLLTDVDATFLAGNGLKTLAMQLLAGRPREPVAISSLRVGPPVSGIGKIVGVGQNYRQHAREMGQVAPDEPPLFLKAPYTVVGPNDEVLIPRNSCKTDYEVELAVVIGATARYLTSPDEALACIAGYTISDDVSEREFQLERGGQWDKGKNCETFNPLGPWLVTVDEVPAPQSLLMQSRVNGEIRQNSSTEDMIFQVPYLIWYISQFMVLLPGDVVNTGTPQGVGSGYDPPRFLQDGDVVETTISGLGYQRHAVEGQPALS